MSKIQRVRGDMMNERPSGVEMFLTLIYYPAGPRHKIRHDWTLTDIYTLEDELLLRAELSSTFDDSEGQIRITTVQSILYLVMRR